MSKTYHVERGALTGAGATKAEAKAALERAIDIAVSHRTAAVEKRLDHVIVVSPAATGWECLTVHPDGHVVFRLFAPHTLSRNDIVRSARLNVAQNAWNAEMSADDECQLICAAGLEGKSSELENWIAFQRAYLRSKAEGLSDAAAFDAACRFPASAATHGNRRDP